MYYELQYDTECVYFSEAEDIDGFVNNKVGGADVRCSMGAGADIETDSKAVEITKLPAGKYRITAGAWGGSEDMTYVFKAGDEEVFNIRPISNYTQCISDEFIINDETTITAEKILTSTPSVRICLDYVFIEKTGGAESLGELKGIAIAQEPYTNEIVEGMPLDIGGLVVNAVYSTGNTVEITDYTLSGYDPNFIGDQTITVGYKGETTTFQVKVIPKPVTKKQIKGIIVSKKPTKCVYTVGDAFDAAGMIVTALYDDGTTEAISGYKVSGYSAGKTGLQQITVEYNDLKALFTVTVNAQPQTPEPAGTISAPKISISSYKGGKTVTLTTTTEGAAIRYTTDGSDPGESETAKVYDGPVECTEDAVIKAMAIKGTDRSKIVSGKITVTQVSAPVSSHSGGLIDLGKIITLTSATSGATIYYTTNGTVPTVSSKKYTGSIVIASDVTIKAIAVKDGCKDSDIYSVSYAVPVKEVPSISVSAGSVEAAAGDNISVPVYFFANENLTEYRFTLCYDAEVFKYDSISSSNALFTSLGNGEVTVLYQGDPMESGEMCSVNLTALQSAEDGDYRLTIKDVRAKGENSNSFDFDIADDSSIKLIGSYNSNIEVYADAILTDKSGNSISLGSINDTSSGSGPKEVTANVSIDEVQVDVNKPQSTVVNVILAVYDRNKALVSLGTMEVDVSDISSVFEHTVEIPEGVEVGSIKMMIWNSLSDMSPLSAASKLI